MATTSLLVKNVKNGDGFIFRKMHLSLFFAFLLVAPLLALEKSKTPPISPAWVFDHWVWEDDENTEDAVLKMIDGYEKHGIPVGAVILDSPWSTEYNNFIVDEKKYPDFKKFVDKMHAKGIKVVLWVTAIVNESYEKDAKSEPSSNKTYNEGKSKGYFINGGETYKWWKGRGAYIDMTNPDAVEWWHKMQDRVLLLGVDGYKVDEVSVMFPTTGKGKNGVVGKRKYKNWYYMDFYEYGLKFNPQFVTMPRSWDIMGYSEGFAPISHAPVTWVGDQRHNWKQDGFIEAISSIFNAANLGYTVMGSDTAGYHGDEPITKNLLIRWAQFSAFCPFFENGGHGAHEPWKHDDETVKIYREYVKMHLMLKPYFYSLMMRAHNGQGNVMTPDKKTLQFTLGEDMLVSIMYEDKDRRTVYLPEGNWYDVTNNKMVVGPAQVEYKVSLKDYPMFLKEGAIIPMHVPQIESGENVAYLNDADMFWLVAAEEGNLDKDFTLYDEGRTPAKISLKSINVAGSALLEISTHATGRQKIFLLQNIKSVSEITGNGSPYPSVKTDEEAFKTLPSYYYDADIQSLLVASPEKNELELIIR